MKKLSHVILVFALFLTSGNIYAQYNEHQIQSQANASQEKERFLKRTVAIARFSNETMYSKGIFYDKENDPMAKQALDILSTKLASTDKFILLERSDLDKIISENMNTDFSKTGAEYIIVGSITEYGRKNVGDANIISRSKTQTVEAGVSVRLIDVSSGLIIYSEEAKGTAEVKSKTTLGVGGTADFDATLSDKAISAAISQLVENIINNCMDRPWKSYFLTVDDDDIFISGGKSQGIHVGDHFLVKEKGKSVKNPQTGMNMELPGKEIGKVEVTFTGGENPDSEFSLVKFISGSFDPEQLTKYYIQEDKP